jgi:site-specific DNA-methyltransferase (adenine-specific)
MVNGVTRGDYVQVMTAMPPSCIDFILTDPPYIARYRDRSGRSLANDDNGSWLEPAFAEMYRLLKTDGFCLSFYGWPKAERFLAAWRQAGFRIAGHLVFRKGYASSARYLQYRHEQAYLLTKGQPPMPASPLPDVMDWTYTGNRLHPTQKSVRMLKPLIDAFSKPGEIVLDPFCGSGSTLVAAQELGRSFVGIELDPAHHRTASAWVHTSVTFFGQTFDNSARAPMPE